MEFLKKILYIKKNSWKFWNQFLERILDKLPAWIRAWFHGGILGDSRDMFHTMKGIFFHFLEQACSNFFNHGPNLSNSI